MKIIIPGIPVSQARMRYFLRGGIVRIFDPNAKDKTTARKHIEPYRGIEEFQYPRVSAIFQMPIPASTSKKDRIMYESGLCKHTKKPDVDNCIKFLLDVLDDIVFFGDQQVSLGPCIKLYHTEPKTIVYINETNQYVEPWELDHELGA